MSNSISHLFFVVLSPSLPPPPPLQKKEKKKVDIYVHGNHICYNDAYVRFLSLYMFIQE
jgi:hypothetical protein